MAGGSSASWLQSPRLPKWVLNGGCVDAPLESDMMGDLSSEKGSGSLRGITKSSSLALCSNRSKSNYNLRACMRRYSSLKRAAKLRKPARCQGDAWTSINQHIYVRTCKYTHAQQNERHGRPQRGVTFNTLRRLREDHGVVAIAPCLATMPSSRRLRGNSGHMSRSSPPLLCCVVLFAVKPKKREASRIKKAGASQQPFFFFHFASFCNCFSVYILT